MQAYALLAAAHGALDAYTGITGDDWKAYEAPAEAQARRRPPPPRSAPSEADAPCGGRKAPALFPRVAEPAPYAERSPRMPISFTLLKAHGQRFDPLPGHDDREFSLSNANAADVLDALGIEDASLG